MQVCKIHLIPDKFTSGVTGSKDLLDAIILTLFGVERPLADILCFTLQIEILKTLQFKGQNLDYGSHDVSIVLINSLTRQ